MICQSVKSISTQRAKKKKFKSKSIEQFIASLVLFTKNSRNVKYFYFLYPHKSELMILTMLTEIQCSHSKVKIKILHGLKHRKSVFQCIHLVFTFICKLYIKRIYRISSYSIDKRHISL